MRPGNASGVRAEKPEKVTLSAADAAPGSKEFPNGRAPAKM
jgi:hypothetical protein